MWNNDDEIVVMEVTIKPPYRPDSIKSHPENQALDQIRKIVEIFVRNQEVSAERHKWESGEKWIDVGRVIQAEPNTSR